MSERQTTTGQGHGPVRLEIELEPRTGHAPAATTQTQPADDLTLCPCCARDLVYPLDWAAAGPNRWAVTLRCPECEWHGGGVYEQDVIDRFDEALDDGTQSVVDDLELLTRSNMQEQIDTFVAALEANLILPEDF